MYPWKVTGKLYEDKKVRILTTSDSRWVIKETPKAEEITNICLVKLTCPRNSVELPAPDKLCGRGWFAMKRYDGSLLRSDYDWRRVAISVIQFLQDFHHGLKMCHNDIKLENIFVQAQNTYVVGDYGDATKPTTEVLRDKPYACIWHYITMGADLNSPAETWRLDLTALGYMLAKLTLDRSQYTFHHECRYRQHYGAGKMTDEQLFALRSSQLALADPVIRAYLDRVSEIAWTAKDPPPRSFYTGLEALFRR